MPVSEKNPEYFFEENLIFFSGLLRKKGIPISTTEIIDALRTLDIINPAAREDFKNALRSTLVKNQRDRAFFDLLFDHFFVPPERHEQRVGEYHAGRKKRDQEIETASNELQFKGEMLQLTEKELSQYTSLSPEQRSRLQNFVYRTETGKNVELQFKPLLETVVKGHLRYWRNRRQLDKKETTAGDGEGASSGPAVQNSTLREMDIQAINTAELPAAEQILHRLSRKLAVKILHRRRAGACSGPIDLRRSMRENMRFGGVIFNLKRKPKRNSRLHLLLLCDVSASMKRYSTFVIHILHGLRETMRELSCFSFSDSLEDLNPEIKGRPSLSGLLDRVVRHSKNWGGGTNIGSALQDLSLMYPAYLNGRTTLIIVSDTKTVSIDRALTELGRLKNRVKKIIWLNPMPEELWDDYRSVRTVAQLVDMWPCSTIAQLEKVLDGRLSR